MLRLSDTIAEKIEKIAERKGLPFSTAIREMICEHLSESASSAIKVVTDAPPSTWE